MSSPDLPDFDATFDQSQSVEFIQKIMGILKEMRGSSDFSTISKLFQSLDCCFYDLESHRDVIVKELLKRNYVSISSTYIIKLNQLSYFSHSDVWRSTLFSFSCLWNYSDACKEITKEILNTKLPSLLISNLTNQTHIENLDSPNYNYLTKATINIIHNVVRDHANVNVFKKVELKTVLVNLIRRNDSDDIGIISMLILACLVDENELDLLSEGENTIKVIIKNIKAAFTNTSKRINGFSIWELVNGLRYISSNDSMKKIFVRENGIKLIFDIIKDPSCEDDVGKCLGVLWNLCFDKDIREILINDFDLRSAIKSFQHHKSSKIRKCYNGIVWLIDEIAEFKQKSKLSDTSKRRASIRDYKYDVFLSYSWANKSIILQILDDLLKSNIRVWIDINQMKGSTLEAMADGIEHSNIFLMAISGKYNTSPNCRTEAEYAFALKKTIIPIIVESKYKPTSWLGLIMGSKTYYEFSGRRIFTESFRGLLNNIEEILGIEGKPNVISTEIPDEIDAVDSADNDSKKVDKSPICKWSKKDVQRWLTSNSVGHLREKFSFVDGKLLMSLINMNSKCPDYLYATLKNEFGIKLADSLRINSAINALDL